MFERTMTAEAARAANEEAERLEAAGVRTLMSTEAGRAFFLSLTRDIYRPTGVRGSPLAQGYSAGRRDVQLAIYATVNRYAPDEVLKAYNENAQRERAR